MNLKISLLVALLSATTKGSKTQLCFFGPDSTGYYLQKVVAVSIAESCEDCLCAPLREACLFGPDSLGNFATSEVDPAFAEDCPRTTCACSSHENYVETA